MQSVSIIGFVAAEPEKRSTSRGDVSVIVAVVQTHIGEETSNCYFRIICWGRLSKLALEAQKDDIIYARGRLVFDAEIGGPRNKDAFEMVAEYVEIPGKISGKLKDEHD